MGGSDHQDQSMTKGCHSDGSKHVVDELQCNG